MLKATMGKTESVRPLRRDAAENRQRLLDAAARIFAERGAEAGVEEVARAAGVGMGTLYRRFPNKQALVDELVADLRRELATIAATALKEPDDVALDRLVRGAAGQLYDRRGCLHQLWHESDAGIEYIEQFRAGIAEALDRGQRAGAIRPEVKPTDVTLGLWGLRGVIEMTHGTAPDAWKRQCEIILAGLHAGPVPLVSPPMTVEEYRAASRPRRQSGQTSTTMGNSIGRRR